MKHIIFVFFLLALSCAHTPEADKFPFPEYENDFETLFKGAVEYSKQYQNDTEAFNKLTLPFAPLSLSSSGKLKPAEFRKYQNFTFGFLSHMFGADPQKRSKEFFCSQSCWLDRIKSIKKSSGEIKNLAGEIRKHKEIKMISHWKMANRFRVDNWFFSENNWSLAVPSKDLELISSGRWETPKEDTKFFDEMKTRVSPLVKKLQKIGFVAMIKSEDDSILAIADGFADNAWGILLLSPSAASKPFNPLEPDQWVQIDDNTWFFVKGGGAQKEMIKI